MNYNKVLLIDDDPFLIELNKMMVEWDGLNKYFTTATSAEEALSLISDLKHKNKPSPDYILLDLNMPEMDGFEFMEQYKQQFYPWHSSTKIIIVTSSTREKDKQKAMSFPFVVGYQEKPLPDNYVAELISKA
nr:response regulator [uncultured Carboxylicivirga sp.]